MMIKELIGQMREDRKGQIIQISSLGGMFGRPAIAPYSASKFAIEGLVEGLYYEMKQFDVKVSLVEPRCIQNSNLPKE